MVTFEDISAIVAERMNKDKRVVNYIFRHSFKFLKCVIQSGDDMRPVKYSYFGKFVLKENSYKRFPVAKQLEQSE